MRQSIYALFGLSLLISSTALGGEGFIIEAEKAQPGIGERVKDASPLAIEAGGHIIIMTITGRLARIHGPYDGTAERQLNIKSDFDDAPSLLGKLTDSILELAEKAANSEDQLGAVKGGDRERAPNPDVITAGTRNFCLEGSTLPSFFTNDPPASDENLIVSRRSNPKQNLRTNWPAQANSTAWPERWPPPQNGRYLWTLGSRGSEAIRIVKVFQNNVWPLERAGIYFDRGCEVQARLIFRAALSAVKPN